MDFVLPIVLTAVVAAVLGAGIVYLLTRNRQPAAPPIDEAGLRAQIQSDVDGARLALRAAKESLSSTQEALVNARERLRLAEERYQVGVGSAIELGDAQIAASNAAAQVVQTDFQLATARAQLLWALGRT